jgi:hypothetical protein
VVPSVFLDGVRVLLLLDGGKTTFTARRNYGLRYDETVA